MMANGVIKMQLLLVMWPSFFAVGGVRGEGGHADGNVARAVGIRRAVADVLAGTARPGVEHAVWVGHVGAAALTHRTASGASTVSPGSPSKWRVLPVTSGSR